MIKMIIWTNIINIKYVNVINLIQPGINCSTIQKKLFIQYCCRPKWQSHVNFSEIEMDNFLVIKISFSSSTPKSPFCIIFWIFKLIFHLLHILMIRKGRCEEKICETRGGERTMVGGRWEGKGEMVRGREDDQNGRSDCMRNATYFSTLSLISNLIKNVLLNK